MTRFADPWWLSLIPIVILVVWYRSRPRRRPTVLFSSLDALRGLPRTFAQRVKRFLPLLEGLGLVCLVVAMARPQAGREDVNLATQGVAIQLVIDRSGSMRDEDLDDDRWDRKRVTRLDVVKDVVRDFVDAEGDLPGRPRDLVGLVTFAGFVQVHCPLTLDHDAFLRVLETVEIPRVAKQDQDLLETALGDGLVIGLNRLREVEAKSRVVVLLSDGRSNVGTATPEAGAKAAAADGIKVYTIGIGTPRRGLDETTLRLVADVTGGEYFNARSSSDLQSVYKTIDELERSEIEAFRATRWRDLHALGLFAGLGLLFLHRALVDTRFRSLP